MADKGIIFSGPMVRALLEGRKTQTRRLYKARWGLGEFKNLKDHGEPNRAYSGLESDPASWGWPYAEDGACDMSLADWPETSGFSKGDRLYVREAWSHTGQGVWDIQAARMVGRSGVIYRGDGDVPGVKYWPSIHMPREFSRLWLKISDVRVQRLWSIDSSDAEAEGIEHHPTARGWKHYGNADLWKAAPETSFETLWDSLHNADGERWQDNPWIVALSFEVHHGNIDVASA